MNSTIDKKNAASSRAGKFEPRSFDPLYGMAGFSEKLLSAHFKLYEGYVSNTNALLEKLSSLEKKEGEATSPAFAEAKRRFGWEFNGMRLHEYYFENLGGDGRLDPKSAISARLSDAFGSFDAWKDDFLATGGMRGIGWSVLYEDDRSGRLFNVWVEEHNMNHLAGGRPLLVLDAFEHAYLPDYGLDRKKYIQAFFSALDWNAVEQRSS